MVETLEMASFARLPRGKMLLQDLELLLKRQGCPDTSSILLKQILQVTFVPQLVYMTEIHRVKRSIYTFTATSRIWITLSAWATLQNTSIRVRKQTITYQSFSHQNPYLSKALRTTLKCFFSVWVFRSDTAVYLCIGRIVDISAANRTRKCVIVTAKYYDEYISLSRIERHDLHHFVFTALILLGPQRWSLNLEISQAPLRTISLSLTIISNIQEAWWVHFLP